MGFKGKRLTRVNVKKNRSNVNKDAQQVFHGFFIVICIETALNFSFRPCVRRSLLKIRSRRRISSLSCVIVKSFEAITSEHLHKCALRDLIKNFFISFFSFFWRGDGEFSSKMCSCIGYTNCPLSAYMRRIPLLQFDKVYHKIR